MELLLKREEKPGALGRRYDLFAKLELTPEELAHVRKTKPEKTIILKDDPRKGQTSWRLCMIPGAILAMVVAAVLLVLFFGLPYVMATVPVAAILWLPCTKLIYNQFRQFVTVGDLITGRTIHCKSLDELYAKEQELSENVKQHMNYLAEMSSLGNTQRIKLNPE